MRTVAILGAGAGGLATTVELCQRGYPVVLWHPRPTRLAALQEAGRVVASGLVEGDAKPEAVAATLADALEDAAVAVVSIPATAHEAIFLELAALGSTVPIVLSPGQTAGALHARAVFARARAALPPVCELSTLPYVARAEGARVTVTGRARVVRAAALPGGDEALSAARELFPAAREVPDVIASSLSNVNAVLHPPLALLSTTWIEATGGAFRFYVDALTPGAVRALERLDEERRALGRVFGHELPSLIEEMAAIGTVERVEDGTAAAIRSGRANESLRAPDSLSHRYFREDLPFGLVPLLALAELAGRPCPLAAALAGLGRVVAGEDAFAGERNRARLGLETASLDELLAWVRG